MRRVMTLVVVACASAACDGVFNLDHVEPQGAAIDAAIDASACPATLVDDEDGDGLDDSCDPCPFANDNVTDADGDGITGICDPDPAVPNQRVLFSGFGLSATSQFITSGGTIEGGTFHTAATAGAGTAFRSIGVDHVSVTAGVGALSLGGSTYHEIGIIFDAAQNATADLDGTYCVIGIGTGSPYTEIYMHQNGGDSPVTGEIGSTAGPLDMVDATIVASFGHNDVPRLNCSFRPPGASIGISGSGTDPPPPGGLSLYTQNTEAKFRFLFVTTGS